MNTATEFAPGVRMVQTISSDTFQGTAANLIAAGLIQAWQLPGAEGNGRTSVGFLADGTRVKKGCSKACRTAGYVRVLVISRLGLRVEVSIGLVAMRLRRDAYFEKRDAEKAEAKRLAKCWPFPVVIGCHAGVFA